jgi:lysophospholipase L1-like esterase
VLSAYGHSWVYGTGARRHSEGFVELAARELAVRLNNQAESGSLSAETARLVIAQPPEPADVFVVMTGFNDARLHGPTPAGQRQYEESLEIVLHALHKADPQAVVLAIEQPYVKDYSGHAPYDQGSNAIVDRYNAILRSTVARFPSARTVVVDGWDAATMLAKDNVHPNDRGHAVLARSLVGAVRSTGKGDVR